MTKSNSPSTASKVPEASAAAEPSATLTREGALAWIVLDNQARMNALTAAMWKAIPGLIAEAEADPAIRVIMLRGAGQKAFCAGADISEFETARTGDAAKTYDALNHAAFEAISTASKPTIAMIHGFCLGGGLGLAAVCDIVSRMKLAIFYSCGQAWAWLSSALGAATAGVGKAGPCQRASVHRPPL